MKILIVTKHRDKHAHAVLWGLRQMGFDPAVWFWEDFPARDRHSLRIEHAGTSQLDLLLGGAPLAGPFDVIWVRRKGQPTAPQGAHPADVEVILNESRKYLDNILPFAGHEHSRWINDIAADCLHSKALQLIAARKLGFRIPDTLMGNDPEKVRDFFAQKNGQVVFKAFLPARLLNDDGSKTVLRTSAISEEHIANDYAIQACPGIYQELIEKQYELRVTVMGQSVLAAKIDSQAGGRTVDWRYEGGRGLTNCSSYTLPAGLAEMCLSLCRALKLSFGCIDLIVPETGAPVFLEVNNVGQFLWKERADQDILALDTFCKFLAYGDSGPDTPRLTLSGYYASAFAETLSEF